MTRKYPQSHCQPYVEQWIEESINTYVDIKKSFILVSLAKKKLYL